MNDLFSPVRLDRYYGEAFKVECPTGSGVRMTLEEVARHTRLSVSGVRKRLEGLKTRARALEEA